MKKGIGDKVLGWFIVQDDAGADVNAEKESTDADDLAAELAEAPVPAPAARRASQPARAPVVAPGNVHDARAFATVYRAAGVSDEERDRLTKVLTLLESLPEEASTDVKRSIVGASLEAFGVSIDRILVTGEGALSALDGYVASGQDRTREVLGEAESRIAKLTKEIEDVRRLMDLQVAAQEELARGATKEKDRVRTVLDFFAARTAGRAAPRPGDAPPAPRLVRLK
jgi:hypothetical protein